MALKLDMLNQNARVPVVLLLDTSQSMGWERESGEKPIDKLNEALVYFKKRIQEDNATRLAVEVAIITFGPVKLMRDFTAIDELTMPQLEADGGTPMGEAIEYALSLTQKRKTAYRKQNLPYHQPLIYLITDGEPDYATGEEDGKRDAKQKALEVAVDLKEQDKNQKLTFFSIGVLKANMAILKEITPPPRPKEPPNNEDEPDRVVKLDGLNFLDLFLWIAQTTKQASKLPPGQQTPIAPKPATLQGDN